MVDVCGEGVCGGWVCGGGCACTCMCKWSVCELPSHDVSLVAPTAQPSHQLCPPHTHKSCSVLYPAMPALPDAPTGPEWWVSGRHGNLSPWPQSLVFALCKVADKLGVVYTDPELAQMVYKVGGGHPSREAIRLLHTKFEGDVEWYPGKVCEDAKPPGRPKVITAVQAQAIATSAMAMKARGEEPTVEAVVAHCPRATLNPDTANPFTAKVILEVFMTRCYDGNPEQPWQHLSPNQKAALSPALKLARHQWGEAMLSKGHQSRWYFNHCVWLDPCSSIIPGSQRSAFDHQQSKLGKRKRWMSADSKRNSKNLKPAPYAGKQVHWGDIRVWWFIVLAKGRVHIEVMPDGWRQNGEGMAYMISLLPGILKTMLGDNAKLPGVLFTDRGPGFYHPSTGSICPEYVASLEAHGFTAWAGDHSKWQPPDIPDILLHETAVSWVRNYLRKHPFKMANTPSGSVHRLTVMLREAAWYINETYAVGQLCLDLPKRLRELVAAEGERLKY